MSSYVVDNELDKILATLADELINYDKRMTDTGAPPIRFVHKYVAPAKKQLQALISQALTAERTKADARLKEIEVKDMLATKAMFESLQLVIARNNGRTDHQRVQSAMESIEILLGQFDVELRQVSSSGEGSNGE